jgi:hypothetical protein
VRQKAYRRAAAEKTVRKIEVEAIAFVVAKPSASAKVGRFVVAPDKPSSLKIVLHPARFKARAARLYSGRQSIRGRSRIS